MTLYYKTLIYICQCTLVLVATATYSVPVYAEPVTSRDLPPLPQPVSNNALVSLVVDGNDYIISFAGLGAGHGHADTLATTWVYSGQDASWSEADPVPGGVGRLASTAAAVGARAYVFGGYTVADDGTEVSTPWVHAFDPVTGRFEARAPMPVPVDDAVAIAWADRYIYLISGWHDSGNINLVQRYDSVEDAWVQATPTPGPAVFGHAGGIVGNSIVYCDGVAIEPHADRRRDFVATSKCFRGTIDTDNSRRIDWRTLPTHPGLARYRMAAAGDERLGAVVFLGGSDNPYNYNGIGYNGEPSQPAPGFLLFDVARGEWQTFDTGEAPTMDHRALVGFRGKLVTAGGMLAGQQTTDRVIAYSLRR